MKKLLSGAAILLSLHLYPQKFENLAPTPPMGWNSWNTFQTNINEKLVMDIADKIVSSGMKDAGYDYVVLDDGWMTMQRDSTTGNLIPDPKKFPSGMKALVDYVHARGLKFGLYNCAGTKTCGGYPGTRGYEYQDARFYASLNIDYLKFDWCSSEKLNAEEAYTTMSKAIRMAGKPMVFSLCEWGNNRPWNWAKNVGQLWRTTGDITSQFEGIKSEGNWHSNGVMKIVEMEDSLRKFAGPGHWNDPDMLEVGNSMTSNQDRAHFTMWAMLAAPLIAGNDLRKMSKETNEILTNKEVIAIDQDAMGMQGFKYSAKDSLEVWFKPLSNDEWAVCFLNRSLKPQQANFNWQHEPVSDDFSKKELDKNAVYKITNLWTKADIGNTKKSLTAMVPPQDVLLLKLSKYLF